MYIVIALILHQVLSLEDSTPPAPSVLDADLLKHFAFEAEESGDYELADRYYKVGRVMVNNGVALDHKHL